MRAASTRTARTGYVAGIGMLIAVSFIVAAISVRHGSHTPTVNNVALLQSREKTAPALPAALLQQLPQVSTEVTLVRAPHLDGPLTDSTSTVVHNTQPVAVFTAPGGAPFAQLPVTQLGSDTWLPVIAAVPGWVQVLLPSRPNGSTGWLTDINLTQARTRDEIRVDIPAAQLRLLHDGRVTGTWTISTGTRDTPTPTGDTFVLAALRDPQQTFSPLILALGIHSTTLDTYAGGPGTVGIHTWGFTPTGQPASHGCIRVPAAALPALAQVPLGSLVRITNSRP